MGNWEEYSPTWVREAPNKPAVYCIKIDGSVVYVGSTRRFRTRFYEHNIRHGYARNVIFPWCDIDESTAYSVKVSWSKKYGDWAMRELRLIRRLKPMFNTAHKHPRVKP